MSTIIPESAGELVPADLPGESKDGTYIYVLAFSSGVVKIGMTQNPAARLKTHEQTARVFRSRIERHWISLPHARAAANERSLIGFCASRAPRADGGASGEYFAGDLFDDAVDFAATLSYEPRRADDGATQARTDYSREESLRILGPEAMADIARQVAAAPPPTPRQVKAIQTIFDAIGATKNFP